MSDINQIIQVNITRQTPVASLPGFGVPAILAQFPATGKTTAPFTRGRYYSSLSELTADGWSASDSVYQAAQAIFSQNPRVPRLFVGRIDSGDASVAASGDAIRAEQDDWYGFEVVGNRGVQFTLSTALITGNQIDATVNGTAMAPVTFATSHAATMAAWKTALETALGVGTVATVSGNSISVYKPGTDLNIATVGVTLGVSQPTTVTSYPLDATKSKAWMAWGASQKKLQALQDSDPATFAADTGVSGTACLAEFAKLMSYDRVFVVYHGTNTEYLASAWMGKELSYDPGARTWAFKNLSGISVDTLTSGQEGLIRGKNANVYTNTASYANTYAGTVAKNLTYIEDTRDLDWLDTTIKVDMFNMLASRGKLPISDPGIQVAGGTLKASLTKASNATVLDSWDVVLPTAASISATDKAAGRLSGLAWTGTRSTSARTLIINGTVSN